MIYEYTFMLTPPSSEVLLTISKAHPLINLERGNSVALAPIDAENVAVTAEKFSIVEVCPVFAEGEDRDRQRIRVVIARQN
ncbi:hypothetical protein [Burkholderia diffusa]|uniref:hypothetical protein n=1 Tax=Burkholderia diffusa TaxID=488732 RepID=UPI000AFB153A|nr:hypothetical protein [Burkholderia diffusa]